jgi:diphthine-ammonia ligase
MDLNKDRKEEKVFVSWSGGKDCNFALYRALEQGLDVRYLLSVFNRKSGRLWPHHFRPQFLAAQAESIGIPLVTKETVEDDYDDDYRSILHQLKEKGINGAVFGDVSLGNNLYDRHLTWINHICKPEGITPHLPHWGFSREKILTDLVEHGFKTIIIIADDILGKDYLGREIDMGLIAELKRKYELSHHGNVGYYHTATLDGPTYKKKLVITDSDEVFERSEKPDLDYWYLDIKEVSLQEK